jgi:hypothetical protein
MDRGLSYYECFFFMVTGNICKSYCYFLYYLTFILITVTGSCDLQLVILLCFRRMYISKAWYICSHFTPRLIWYGIGVSLGLIRIRISVKWRLSLANFICYCLRSTMLGWCVSTGICCLCVYENAPASSFVNILALSDIYYLPNKIHFYSFFRLNYDFLGWLGLKWVSQRGKSLLLKQFFKNRKIFIWVSAEVKIIFTMSRST